jgi:alpha-galactosidase/6-phospho-beta-glucosidase family protein
MKNIILTVIGGGSVNWMRGLMKDFYLLDEISGGEIRLVDPNREHVEAVADMLKAFNVMRNKDYKISICEDRKKALTNANFVLTTFSPGAMEAFRYDLEIPIKYGIRQPVSMTVGPCGISAALRTIPVAYEIVEDMEEVCPGAWLLNVTNPMSAVTRAMNMAAKTVKVIGICHEFHALHHLIGPMLGLKKPEGMLVTDYLYNWLPSQGFEYTVAGLNHFIWLTKASLNGEDVIPKIRSYCNEHWEIINENSNNNTQATKVYKSNHAAKLALCRQFGYLPLAGDRHLVEFYPSLCNIRNGYAMKYGACKTTVDYREFEKFRQLDYIKKIGKGAVDVVWEKSGEELLDIVRAVINNTPITAILNLPNNGQVRNMPKDVIVETLATLDARGVVPKQSGELPGSVGSLCRLHADVHELTVKAALSGDRNLFVEALSLDPSSGCADFSEIPALADELLQVNKKWLPRFYK